jgi:hypothetical protein
MLVLDIYHSYWNSFICFGIDSAALSLLKTTIHEVMAYSKKFDCFLAEQSQSHLEDERKDHQQCLEIPSDLNSPYSPPAMNIFSFAQARL